METDNGEAFLERNIFTSQIRSDTIPAERKKIMFLKIQKIYYLQRKTTTDDKEHVLIPELKLR